MKEKKENLLAKHRLAPDGCLCLPILELKRARLLAEYEALRQRMDRQHVGSKTREKTLGALLKVGNKLRAIKEVIYEIAEAHRIAESMVGIEIAGAVRYRVSRNSDRRRSCHGKVRHSECSAREAAREMDERTGESYDAYPCRHCPHWHVGHKPGV